MEEADIRELESHKTRWKSCFEAFRKSTRASLEVSGVVGWGSLFRGISLGCLEEIALQSLSTERAVYSPLALLLSWTRPPRQRTRSFKIPGLSCFTQIFFAGAKLTNFRSVFVVCSNGPWWEMLEKNLTALNCQPVRFAAEPKHCIENGYPEGLNTKRQFHIVFVDLQITNKEQVAEMKRLQRSAKVCLRLEFPPFQPSRAELILSSSTCAEATILQR